MGPDSEQTERLETERLVLSPLPPAAAAALPDDRDQAARVIGSNLASDWPQEELFDVLPLQAATGAEFVAAGPLFEGLRSVKDTDEQEALRRAGGAVDGVLREHRSSTGHNAQTFCLVKSA